MTELSRCKPPGRPHVWPEWRTISAVFGLQHRNCERCGKKALRTDPHFTSWRSNPVTPQPGTHKETT